MEYNRIIQGHTPSVLKTLPPEIINCCVTSPPYWGLRDYGIEPTIWDGEKGCEHEWGNKTITLKHKAGETNPGKESWFKDRGASNDIGNCFCLKCGAWKGSLGLEPTFELYIKHLCDIFDEIKRVLRKDGTCWVNIGDSYWGGGQGGADYGGKEIVPSSNFGHVAKGKNYLNKSLCDIPYRFSIEMINRGWIKRNTIIWHKPNCMPASAKDRYTVDFEYIFFFTKSNKALFWTNEKTLKCVGKQPPGTKGIEGVDWEWGIDSKGKPKKISLWTGHDYWFEQQFDEYTKPLDRWGGNNLEAKNESEWDKGTGQKSYRDRNMRPNEQGRNKRTVWTIPIIDKREVGENGTANDTSWNNNPKGHLGSYEQGKNRRTVWSINTKPFKEAHFAVFPEALIEPIIQAGCPRYVCKKCGKARVKILEPTEEYKKYLGKGNLIEHHSGQDTKTKYKVKVNAEYNFKDYTDCGCDAGFEPGITLDPFMGAGTTAKVAKKQGKRYLGIELKQEYIDMADKGIRKIPETLF